MKSYYKLFQERFNLSTEIDDKWTELWNSGKREESIEYLKSIGATELDIDTYRLKYTINEYTKGKYSLKEKEEMINGLIKFKDLVLSSKIKYSEKTHKDEAVIETTKGLIRVIPFTSIAPKIKELHPEIDTDNRAGKCFDWAYYITLGLGIPNDIVTGYIYGYTNISKFLHSWIEVDYKEEEWVIDGTLNAMINKDGYYLLQKAEVISRISRDTFIEDIENYLTHIDGIQLDVYYVFRDEMINDLDRNKLSFK